ncbi:hypothetical protein FRC17_003876 [Serendipita sp. 399]|nr:hypothetical protein FRC17_003876 [Serendipita sp. 399]
MSVIIGIIPIGSDLTLRDEYPLVQSRCIYSVVDVYTIAELVQDYCSAAPINRDVEYVFPLPPSAAICSFKAVIDDTKTIKGVVKEKGEAKKAFDQAVAQGKTAGLLQQDHADVFRASLGNIKPKTKISVHISFVSIVPHDGSSPQALRITMPTAIAPRYGTPPTNIPWFHNAQNCFELSVSVQMSKPITSVSSPSHPIGLTLGCHQRELAGDHDPSKAFVYLGESTMLDKDIVIIISAQGLDTPRCSIERWLKGEGAEETTDAYALTLVPKFDLPALPRQEYIFLVDRSGSMKGKRITAVKAALQILLRSLPSRDTSFNIVSFGSKFTSLWLHSQAYSAESMEEASRHVDGFEANYGGTELRSALKFAFDSRQDIQSPQREKVPTSVFVLTDGRTWDMDGITNIVSQCCENAKTHGSLLRTFTLGVGKHVSTAMCEGIARAGKGTAVFVAEGEKPDAKLMSLLKAARGGVVEDLAVDWGDFKDSMDKEEDFKMIPTSGSVDSNSPPSPLPQSQPSLNLFDERHVDTPAEVGAQKAITLLDPPPKIQQAPKSNKLPIPLYPGFRCSIFAIVKRGPNPGLHSANIRITGKVMGRDVELQIPVLPISVYSGVVEEKVEGGRLLHSLAAKALIQAFEDLPNAPENRAQIERLGKRYSLASSATSFVAIDDETKERIATEAIYGSEGGQEDEWEEFSAAPVVASANGPRFGSSASLSAAGSSTTGALVGFSSAVHGHVSLAANDNRRFMSFRRSRAVPPAPEPSSTPVTRSQHAYAPQSSVQVTGSSDSNFGVSQVRRVHTVKSAVSPPPSTFYTPVAPPQHAYASPSSIQGSTGSPPVYEEFSAGSSFRNNNFHKKKIHTLGSRSSDSADVVEPQAITNVVGSREKKRSSLMSKLLSVRGILGSRDSEAPSSTPAVSVPSAKAEPQGQVDSSLNPSGVLGSQRLETTATPSFRPVVTFNSNIASGAAPEGSRSSSSTIRVLSVETIARTQNFDGSFPSDDAHIRFVVGSKRFSQACELPPIIRQLGEGDSTAMDTARNVIWATVLTYTCLQKRFGGEHASWEMLVEKAKEYVEKELVGFGLEGSLVTKTMVELENAALAVF